MTTFTEGNRTAEFLISEAAGHRSRDVITLAAGISGTLAAGTVLGKVTSGGAYNIYDPGASDGTQTVAAILFEAGGASARRTIVNADAEVKASKLTWFAGANAGQIATGKAGLATLGIKTR
jgi:hypothetical protein